MPSFEFQSMLHRTRSEMLNAIAEEWITAGGSNTNADVTEWLAKMTDAELAAEAIEGWGLDQVGQSDDEPSHMTEQGYDAADLAEAFARFRKAKIGDVAA